MIVPSKIDYERLERACELIKSGNYRYRGEGKTFAYITLMAGEVLLGDKGNTYVYIGENVESTVGVVTEFRRYLTMIECEAHPISAVYGKITHITLSTTQKFLFLPAKQFVLFPEFAKGYTINRVFFDVSERMRTVLMKQGGYIEAISTLRGQMPYNGDVI